MARNRSLYTNLVLGIYTQDGIDSEFLSDLAQALPFKWEGHPGRGVLAEVPAARVRRAKWEVAAATKEVKTHLWKFNRGNWEDDSQGGYTAWAYRELRALEADQAKASKRLAALLA